MPSLGLVSMRTHAIFDLHMHLCVLDGVVAQGRPGLVFRGAPVDEACAERVQAAVRQRVVVFPKRLRYFLDRDADCLKRVGWGHEQPKNCRFI